MGRDSAGYSLCRVARYCYIPYILLKPSFSWLRLETIDYSCNTSMRKTCLYYTLIACLCALSLQAAPRLTVVAVVDGLTTENLSTLRLYWSPGGLRTLSEEAFQTSVAFPHLVYGGNETTATLVTGTTPDLHGYTMDRYFMRRERKVYPMYSKKY